MIRLFGWHKQLPNISINTKTLIRRWLKTRRPQAAIPAAAEGGGAHGYIACLAVNLWNTSVGEEYR